jgi:hypothetical protein
MINDYTNYPRITIEHGVYRNGTPMKVTLSTIMDWNEFVVAYELNNRGTKSIFHTPGAAYHNYRNAVNELRDKQ